MKRSVLLCLGLSALLGACSDKQPAHAPVPPSASAAASIATLAKDAEMKSAAAKKVLSSSLMAAVFGQDYRPASDDALVELPGVDHRDKVGMYVLSAVSVSQLPSGQVVLIANAETADEQGKAYSAHASSGLLNVFLLRQVDGKWHVLKRHENVAALGSFGQLGEVVWIQLATGRPGFVVINGGNWQGYSIGGLALFDPLAESMKELGGAALYSNNDAACEPESAKCWRVAGKWRLVPAAAKTAKYDDLLIDFIGEESIDPNGYGDEQRPAKRVTRKYTVQTRYAYDGKQYQLVSGSNPVPGI